MPVTERQRHQLFTRAEAVLGADEAATMMELIAPHQLDQLATKADLALLRVELRAELRAELRHCATKDDLRQYATKADLHEALHRQTRTFVTWLLASQSALIALVVVAIVRAG